MMQKLRIACDLFMLGLSLGVGAREKVRLIQFLFLGRLIKRQQIRSSSFLICCLGKAVTVHIRNNFADAFILNEVFRHNEYADDLPVSAPQPIFDIGANIGLVTVYLTIRYPGARIHCFEPDPENYTQLLLNTNELQGITCYPLAISKTNGSMTFYQSSLFHMRNSLLPIDNATKITVETVTLHEALIRTKEEKIAMLKFDVEGGERDIFTPDVPYKKIESIIGELHPYRMDKSEYEILMTLLNSHFALGLRTEGKKVFVYGTAH